MSRENRATREEIFSRLRELLGDEAINVSNRVYRLALEKNYEASLSELKEYDVKLGGVGVYKSEGKKMTGIYRAFFYVELPFVAKNAEEDSRDIIEAACGYLEALIKRVRRLSFVEKLKDSYKDGIPLGGLLHKVKDLLPPNVFDTAIWLNKNVYVFAKHNYDFGDD